MLNKILGPGMRRQQPAMLRTHPPTKDRIAALMKFDFETRSAHALPESVFPSERRIPPANHSKVMKRPRYRFVSGVWR
jgi:predicted Zn-dependent protease